MEIEEAEEICIIDMLLTFRWDETLGTRGNHNGYVITNFHLFHCTLAQLVPIWHALV